MELFPLGKMSLVSGLQGLQPHQVSKRGHFLASSTSLGYFEDLEERNLSIPIGTENEFGC